MAILRPNGNFLPPAAGQRLAGRAGLSGKFLGEVERGEKSISLDSLAHLARALRLPLVALVKGLETRKKA
jgi:transcriptional regulator with XRE-family HTH domain